MWPPKSRVCKFLIVLSEIPKQYGVLLHTVFLKIFCQAKGDYVFEASFNWVVTSNSATSPNAEMLQNCIHMEEVLIYPEKGHFKK